LRLDDDDFFFADFVAVDMESPKGGKIILVVKCVLVQMLKDEGGRVNVFPSTVSPLPSSFSYAFSQER
jgi:hypothetical protein